MVGQRIEKLFESLDAASVMIASEASRQNQTWPYITVSHWSSKAARIVEIGDIGESMIALAPIVQQDMVDNWTTYVNQQAPQMYQNSKDSNETIQDLILHTLPYVHSYTVDNTTASPVERQGPVAPIWQSYPLRKGEFNPLIQELATNFDVFYGLDGDTHLVEATRISLHPVISLPSIMLEDPITKRRIAKSEIVQPIFEQVDTRAANGTVVAVLWWQIDWGTVLAGLMDDEVSGILAVLRSSCRTGDRQGRSRSLTYRINGPESILLASRDIHDSEFDVMEVSEILFDVGQSNEESMEDCTPKVSLHLYPTTDFQNKYLTEKALYYVGIVVVIFSFTSSVFLLYDHFVKERQKVVMDRIQRQDIIVSDVFPTAIRDRLYNNQQTKDDDMMDPLDFGGPSATYGSAPLADLFPNTSVIFADIVGFTAWSSQREPSQVFILLETIYSAFDKIAYRHGVFKVETVGDCYVAVAGLPEPDEEHAVAACRFARSCLKKMKELTRKLEVTLGPDTADLATRIGIHR